MRREYHTSRSRLTAVILTAVLAVALIASSSAAFAADFYYGDVNPGPLGKLAAPKVTAKTTGRTSIQLKWKPVKGAKGYAIYRSEGLFNRNFKRVKTIKNGNTSSFKDAKCSRDTLYEYEVFAYKYQNGRKVYSQADRFTANSGVVQPSVSPWPYSTEEMGVNVRSSGADRIVIYRSDTEDGTYSKVADYDLEDYYWVDQNVIFAGTYYYKAKAYKKINGKTYASQWSDAASASVRDPHLDIAVEDLNRQEAKADVFIYKLTSKATNFPATIYRSGENEFEKFDYTYRGEKTVGGSHWTSEVKVTLDSYSLDGKNYQKMPESLLLQPGTDIWLKFTAADPVTYYKDGRISLDIGYNGYRVDAGAIALSTTRAPYFSYDY